jgi:hypothetical protein
MGRVPGGLSVPRPAIEPWLEDSDCGFGAGGHAVLRAVRHAAEFSETPARWVRPAMPPGSHAPAWPAR